MGHSLPDLSVVFVLWYSGTAPAQEFDYHPVLSDNFILSLGAFRSDNSFKMSAEGVIEDEIENEIDFGNSVGVDESTTLFNGQLRWKFGKERKWSLFGQYFDAESSGEAVLTEDVEWQDITFREGTLVGSGVDVAISRVFVGRSIVKNQRHDFGIGAGLHNLDLSTFIEGNAQIDDNDTGFRRSEASNNQPLPNIGFWYNVSPARNWLIHARIDWISASIGDYDGTLWNAAAGVNYQAFRHVGFDLTYQYFNLNANINGSNWNGGVDVQYRGPVLAVTINW